MLELNSCIINGFLISIVTGLYWVSMQSLTIALSLYECNEDKDGKTMTRIGLCIMLLNIVIFIIHQFMLNDISEFNQRIMHISVTFMIIAIISIYISVLVKIISSKFRFNKISTLFSDSYDNYINIIDKEDTPYSYEEYTDIQNKCSLEIARFDLFTDIGILNTAITIVGIISMV